MPCPARRRRLAVLVALAIMLLAGCDASSPSAAHVRVATSTATSATAPLAFHIVRYSSGRAGIAPFERPVADSVKAQQLYQYILGMAPAPQLTGCPQDIGGGYLINFTRGDAIVLQALMPASGCPYLALSGSNGCRSLNQAFKEQLAQTLSVTTDDLWVRNNTAAPGGPVAPINPPKPWLWTSCLPNNG